MNGKLIKLAVAGVAAVALAAGGGTFAAWSDFVDVAGNNAGAGTLSLNVGPNGGGDLKFDHVSMAPQQINQEREVYIASNAATSTPNARLFISLTNLVGTEDGCDGNSEIVADPACANPGGSQGQFITDATLQISSYAVNSPGDCTEGYAPAGKAVTAQYGGSLLTVEQKTNAPNSAHELTGDGTSFGGTALPVLTPGQGICVSMTIGLAAGVSNASQGDSASWTTHFDLEQALA
jgi:predicted ribosomally synthesized peptide with SipW-like signal peptide